jgi:hypothetical protein
MSTPIITARRNLAQRISKLLLKGGEIGMTPWQLRQVQGAIERLEEERYRAAALGRPAGRRGCGRIAAPML